MAELMWATLDVAASVYALWAATCIAGLYFGWWKFDNEKREFVRG